MAGISGVRGRVVDLEVTPSITWSGPGDRKLPRRSWWCLQEIYWHWNSETFQLSPPSNTHGQASTHVQKQSTQVCAPHTYTQSIPTHTQARTHTEATAEWSQLERQRHFGLSTATISGQVRTTHTDAHKHTYTHWHTCPSGPKLLLTQSRPTLTNTWKCLMKAFLTSSNNVCTVVVSPLSLRVFKSLNNFHYLY